MGTLNHEVWLSSLLYLSYFLVCTTRFLADQAFTNMGLPVRWWLHWKYHFMWSFPCTVSVGVGVVFAFSCLLACLFAFNICLLALISFFLLLLLGFVVSSFTCFVRRLVRMKPCVTHETSWVKWKRVCTTISSWLYIILPLYDEIVPLSPWYIEGKYILFEVNLGVDTTLAR